MSPTSAFDAIIIGSGQGGNPLAVALAGAGLRTALIEREHNTALRDAIFAHPTLSELLNTLFATLDEALPLEQCSPAAMSA